MDKYLATSHYIDWKDASITSLAASLSEGVVLQEIMAKNCFEWVRDNIKHSADYELNPVTCKASAVLKYRTGYCYAKSHLLAALLRANQIPTGLCYQRLRISGEGAPYCLHGLNAVFLEPYGWYRLDPRGNKAGVNAQFIPPVEQRAFPVAPPEKVDFPEIWETPLPAVVAVLEKHQTWQAVMRNLPDIELKRSVSDVRK